MAVALPTLSPQMLRAGARQAGESCAVNANAVLALFGFHDSFTQAASALAVYLIVLHALTCVSMVLVTRRRR